MPTNRIINYPPLQGLLIEGWNGSIAVVDGVFERTANSVNKTLHVRIVEPQGHHKKYDYLCWTGKQIKRVLGRS